jgi:hypothetical protein
MRGINYNGPQSTTKFADVLADVGTCERDIDWLLKLNANAIFVADLEPLQDHAPCMKAFDAVGIYVVVKFEIASELLVSWSYDHYEKFLRVIDNMAGYRNTLGIRAGLISARPDKATTASINDYARLKAVVRDLKGYIQDKRLREIPVRVAAWSDVPIIESYIVSYMTCLGEESQPDFIVVVLKWSTGDTYGYCHTPDEMSTILDIFDTVDLPILAELVVCETQGNDDYSQVNQTFALNQSALLSGIHFGEFFNTSSERLGKTL